MPTIPNTFTHEGVQFAWAFHNTKDLAGLKVLDVWRHDEGSSVTDLARHPLVPREVYSEERLDQLILSSASRLLKQVRNRERR